MCSGYDNAIKVGGNTEGCAMKKIFWLLPCLALALSGADVSGKWSGTIDVEDAGNSTPVQVELVPGQVSIIAPEQMRTLLDNVRPEYLPWLCVAAFAGIRSEEIAPDYKSKKSPLMWEDFDWKHKVIIVRAETAKTKHEREVPLLPNLAKWLAPWRGATGPVIGDAAQPSKRETARLGASIGGWKHNALRDSYCSYRARMTQNVPQVSYEMGNSIIMVKRSYHRRQPIRTARAWFNIRPEKASNVVFVKAPLEIDGFQNSRIKSSKKFQNPNHIRCHNYR
jgi:integrase